MSDLEYDASSAVLDCRRLWLRVGRSLRSHAIILAKEGESLEALTVAMQANACFWQAVGESEEDISAKAWIDRSEQAS